MGRKNFERLGARLKLLRSERPGWTQATVAAEVGVRQNTYAQWESGVRFPASDTSLASLCRLYGVSADYLLGLVDERLPWRGG